MPDGSERLLGHCYGRRQFASGEPVLHGEPIYTSTLLHIEGDRAETANSVYILGEPQSEAPANIST